MGIMSCPNLYDFNFLQYPLTSFVSPIFLILALSVGTALILSSIATGEMKRGDWIELGTFIVVAMVLLLIFRNAGLMARAGGPPKGGGHHLIIPKGGTGKLSLRGFLKNQWGRFMPKFIRESSANVIKKGTTQTEYLLWHFKVDPFFSGTRGWRPPPGIARY